MEKTMLTNFEIDPHSSFNMHSHLSEQITMVLEGELFFKVRDKIVCVKKGEVIAIPSAMPHAVFTKSSPVTAVDVWSPVMEKYEHDKMNVVSKKMFKPRLWGLIKAFVIMSIESLGDTGIVKIDKDTNGSETEIIITEGIGMKS